MLVGHATWRSRISGPAAPERPGETAAGPNTHSEPGVAPTPALRLRSNLLWAQLMVRSLDSMCSPARGGWRFRLIALIEDPRVIRRILGHLGLPTDVPAARARPPRAPPIPFEPFHDRAEDDLSIP